MDFFALQRIRLDVEATLDELRNKLAVAYRENRDLRDRLREAEFRHEMALDRIRDIGEALLRGGEFAAVTADALKAMVTVDRGE
jgi:hypothetical protein